MFELQATQLFRAVLSAKNIIVVPHQRPDGDAFGAATAIIEFCRSVEKPAVLFCATQADPQLQFLPHAGELTSNPAVFEHIHEDTLTVVVDSGDLGYNGVAPYVKEGMHIANIDHHVTNEYYGTYNLVDVKASSTCEIVYRLFMQNKVKMNKNMATSLLTGIITDTDNFTNSATSDLAIDIASDLVRAGANFNLIKKNIYQSTPIAAFKLWGEMLSRLTHHEPIDMVYTYLTHADVLKHQVSEADMSGMSNFMNAMSDGVAGLILKEREDGTVKGSFRTTREDVDVSAMAQHFGGGGHKKAAGFTVEGPMDKALKYILSELEEHFPKQATVKSSA